MQRIARRASGNRFELPGLRFELRGRGCIGWLTTSSLDACCFTSAMPWTSRRLHWSRMWKSAWRWSDRAVTRPAI